MAIIDQLDKLVFDAVSSNIYNSNRQYADVLDGPLAFKTGNAHPHSDIANKLIPGPDSLPPSKMHGPPAMNRGEIYEGKSMPGRAGGSYDKDLAFKTRNEHPHSDIANKLIPGPDSTPSVRMHGPPALNQAEIYQGSKSLENSNLAIPSNTATQLQSISRESDRFQLAEKAYQKGAFSEDNRNNQYDNRESFFYGKFSPMASHTKGTLGVLNRVDPFAISNWFRGILRETGIELRAGQPSRNAEDITKGITFLASQFLLSSFNPTDLEVGGIANAIYNPLHIPLSVIPFLRTTTTIGSPNSAAAFSITGEVYSTAIAATVATHTERLVLMRSGLYKKSISATDIAKFEIPTPGFLGDAAKSKGYDTLQRPGIATPVSIQGQVDGEGLTSALALKLPIHKNIYSEGSSYPTNAIKDLTSLEADSKKSTKTPQEIKLSKLFQSPAIPTGIQYSYEAIRANFTDGLSAIYDSPDNVDVKISEDEDESGVVLEENVAVTDATNYLPFSFQDLRDSDKHLYFRAFLKPGYSETFTPQWQTERYYGRVDLMPIYIGTDRNINLSFDVVAWKPSDLPLMWKKLHRLQSMVYPMYDNNMFLKSGPIIRMKVGDLFCSTNNQQNNIVKKGLPGYITSLNFDFDDGIWNMKTDFKIPRKVLITLSFTVVHEGNPGIYPFDTAVSFAEGVVDTAGNNKVFGALTVDNVNSVGDVTYKASDGAIRGIMNSINNNRG